MGCLKQDMHSTGMTGNSQVRMQIVLKQYQLLGLVWMWVQP